MRAQTLALKLLAALAISSTALSCPGRHKPEPAGQPERRPPAPTAPPKLELSCWVECDPVEAGVGLAHITWEEPKTSTTAVKQLEFTETKRGFDLREYATLRLGSPRPRPPAPALSKPQLQDVPAFDVRARQLSLPRSAGGPAHVVLEGLEPGTYYYWRMRTQAAGRWIVLGSTSCAAPTCPVDSP